MKDLSIPVDCLSQVGKLPEKQAGGVINVGAKPDLHLMSSRFLVIFSLDRPPFECYAEYVACERGFPEDYMLTLHMSVPTS